MRHDHGYEKVHESIRLRVADWLIRKRLMASFSHAFGGMRTEELPEDLRSDFVELCEALHREEGHARIYRRFLQTGSRGATA